MCERAERAAEPSPWGRVGSVVMLASVLGFATLMTLAMRAHPGGTRWDRSALGYSRWSEFFFDGQARVALASELRRSPESIR
jgi:hypothetical protein